MNEAFEIPVLYKGENLSLPAEFIVLENIYKIQIEVDGQEITFEPDEEKKFRAIMNPKRLKAGQKIDVDLLIAVASKLESYCNIRSYYWISSYNKSSICDSFCINDCFEQDKNEATIY